MDLSVCDFISHSIQIQSIHFLIVAHEICVEPTTKMFAFLIQSKESNKIVVS